jgi:hypothetical protein
MAGLAIREVTNQPKEPAKLPRPFAGQLGVPEAMPMNLLQLCQWLYDSQLGTAIRESQFAFPLIESVHVLGITLLVGTVLFVDLRLLGVLMKDEPVSDVVNRVLPITWTGFLVQVVSGVFLFWAKASQYYGNPAFRWKVLLLVLAGLNPLIFHSTVYRGVSAWNEKHTTPFRAKLAGLLSLTFWSGVIIAGRATAYFGK